MHKRTSRATRKKLFVNSYISLKKKCLLEIHHDDYHRSLIAASLSVPLRCVRVAISSNRIHRKTTWNSFWQWFHKVFLSFINCPKSSKVVYFVLWSHHELHKNEEMVLAHLWKFKIVFSLPFWFSVFLNIQ